MCNKMKIGALPILFVILVLSGACDSTQTSNDESSTTELAAVTAVSFTGDAGSYTFSVTIQSLDTGCTQYADWWEVIRPDGSLVYRRILTHSHIDEQPFTRSGGPVNVTADEDILVRAHMNSNGYGEQVFRGSIELGLIPVSIESSFAENLEFEDPLPDSCAF